jgi:isopenicillin N synthase-like dioxygenase
MPIPSNDERVPVVDLSVLRRPLRESDAGRRARMLERLRDACRTCGVFYVENHGVPENVLRDAAAQFDAFFDLPLEERMEIAVGPGQACGYEPLVPQVRELNDSFNCAFGMDKFPDLDLPDPGPNQWPRRPAGFEAMVRDTVSALHRLGVDVMSSLALSLDLPADHFDPMIFDLNIGPLLAGSMRARRYPPRRDYEGRLGTNAHVDGLPLAFIVQNDVPGLETEIPGEGWTTIEPRPGAIVCQLGSLFARWTNDRYVPNRHRVVNDDPVRDRRSIIYWFPIHPEAMIACLPTCCSAADPPRYAPILYKRYLAEWVRSLAEVT